MNKKILGYRGYIGSRSYSGIDYPHNIQNLLIRNYCQKHQLFYLLSATEYIMPGCYVALEEILNNLDSIAGIVLFSMFMLPESASARLSIYKRILYAGKTIHTALEEMTILTSKDITKFEHIIKLNNITLNNQALTDLREFCA